MKMLKLLTVALLFATPAASQPLWKPFQVASIPLTRAGLASPGANAPVAGQPLNLIITSGLWTSPTDLTPVSQYANGWTADMTLNATAPAGATSAYAQGTQATQYLSIPVTIPTYSTPGGVMTSGTTTRTVWATSWLRQVWPNYTLPTEATNAGNAQIALTLSGYIHKPASDVVGNATTLSGLYTSGAVVSTATSGIPVTNNSTLNYPTPIGAFVTEPGLRYDGSASFTVEFTGAQAYAQGGVPLAGVVLTATDNNGHTASKTISTLTPSTRQVSTSCTATNGSAVLTSCGDTTRFLVGQRVTVIGIPGQPKLLSKTASTLTFGVTAQCVTTLNSGDITINGTPGVNEGLADGAFAGASITDANITTPSGVASITSETLTADVTIPIGKATAAKVHTGATGVTATSAHACTINHIYQGVTGTVAVTLGNPVPVYAATFTSSDLAAFTDGVGTVRAQAYPVIGDVVLDTQAGADGTNIDWNGLTFAANGTTISPNLHNLWFYIDTANHYSPFYVWISGTAGGSPAVQSTSADPGSTAYFATPFAALTAAKAFNGTGSRGHATDINGAVFCFLAAGSPYLGFGGAVDTSVTVNKPGITLTSVTSGQACPATGAAGSDISVTLGHSATAANIKVAMNTHINNLKLSDTAAVIQGSDATKPTTALATYAVFDGDVFKPTAGSPLIFQVGTWYIANSYVDQASFEGNVLTEFNVNTNEPALLLGNTLACGSFTATLASTRIFAALGNVGWSCSPALPSDLATATSFIQPLSVVDGFNKWMGVQIQTNFVAPQNFLQTNTIVENINNSALVPALKITADGVNVPSANIYRTYGTVIGERTNTDYLEGISSVSGAIAVATGGSFPAGSYALMLTFARVGNPTVETSTDGLLTSASTVTKTTVVLNGSIKVVLPCDPNYVATLYADTTVTGTNASATVGHYAAMAAGALLAAGGSTTLGQDGIQLKMCQTVVLTNVGTAHTSPSLAGLTAHNELKTPFIQRFNIDENVNRKNDTYGGTTGQSNSIASGGRVGNWDGRWHVDDIGNVSVTGTVIGSGLGPLTGFADVLNWNENYNTLNSATDLSWVKYKSDRSWGGHSASLLSPALNLGQGNYCVDSSVTNAASRVPSGMSAWGTDITGAARLNNGSGWAGAYEAGCR